MKPLTREEEGMLQKIFRRAYGRARPQVDTRETPFGTLELIRHPILAPGKTKKGKAKR